MMKYFFILAMICSATANAVDINSIRTLYAKAGTDETANAQILLILKSVDTNEPLLLGYKASATMMMAKFANNPLSKFSYFNKGKRMLEQAIRLDGTNIELRFLRFMAQANAPSFLGYSNNIESDKDFILSQITHITDNGLKQYVGRLMTDSDALKDDEKLLLSQFT